jgi:hypothetical protein
MWINLSKEEFDIIINALQHCNLYGLSFALKHQTNESSPLNTKHTKLNAIKAAQTYFSANDLIIKEDCVEWTEEGDALVMAWQKVPSAFIEEANSDCGCNKNS